MAAYNENDMGVCEGDFNFLLHGANISALFELCDQIIYNRHKFIQSFWYIKLLK